MNQEEKLVIEMLASMGFRAEKIKETNNETPDFLVYCEVEKYFVELKTKLDDLSGAKDKVLATGQVYEKTTRISYQNSVAKRVKKASSQLTSLDIDVDYRIVWLLALGENTEIQMEQFEKTLYGAADLIDLDADLNVMKSCYYFNESAFFTHREHIDAAVISFIEGAKLSSRLCLNDHSPKYISFKGGEFCKAFGDYVTDPSAKETRGDAYIVDGGVNRQETTSVLKYVQQKYKKERLINLNFKQHSASILVKDQQA